MVCNIYEYSPVFSDMFSLQNFFVFSLLFLEKLRQWSILIDCRFEIRWLPTFFEKVKGNPNAMAVKGIVDRHDGSMELLIIFK